MAGIPPDGQDCFWPQHRELPSHRTGQAIWPDNDAHVDCVELRVDDGAIANRATHAQIPFQQRRQRRAGGLGVIGAGFVPIH
jgi:hypothetical protein